MNTHTFQVFQLRGMDERWLAEGNDALYIQDMTWVPNDAWRTCGGWDAYFTQSPYYHVLYTEVTETEENPENTTDTDQSDSDVNGIYAAINKAATNIFNKNKKTTIEPYYVHTIGWPTVRSIHWFAQHNGARQFLVYEQQAFDPDKIKINTERLELRYFDGSRNASAYSTSWDYEPSRVMVEFARRRDNTVARADIGRGLNAISDRYDAGLAIPTQSQAWGGRLYMVNGHQAPIVFNGEYVERAGFENPPSPPQASAGDWMGTSTFCFAVGRMDMDSTSSSKQRGKFGLFDDYNYWGMGPKSFAKFGVGKYRAANLSLFGAGGDETKFRDGKQVGEIAWSLYDKERAIKAALKLNQQLDRRRVGWQYKVTFVNERGQESEPSEASNVAVFLNGTGKWNQHGQCFITVNLPRGPSECVARRVYRTRNVYDSKGNMVSMGDSTRFYFLKEIQDNMTDMFVDGHPDTSLGSLLSTRLLGGFPPGTRFLASFKNTMFAAGSTSNTIYFSAPNFPEMFPERFVLHVGDDDGGPITGMRATKNALVVFKSRGIYLIKGDPHNGFYAQTLNKDIGCWAPNSIAEVPGLGLIFLSEKEVCLLEGALENTGTVTGVVKLSTEIPSQMELINTSGAVRAVGAVYLKDHEYWLSVPTHGSSKNNFLLVYHYKIGSWSVRKNFPAACAAHSNDHRGYMFFGVEQPDGFSTGISGSGYSEWSKRLFPSLGHQGIAVYSKGYPMKGGDHPNLVKIGSNRVEPMYRTTNLPFGSVYKTTHPAHLLVYGVGYGDNDMSINYRVNRSLFDIRDLRQPADQQDPNERYPVYGKARWEKDYWGEYRPTVIRYDISTSHKGPVREVGITFATSEDSASGTKIEIVGYDIEAKVGEQRNIKPLNEALRPDRR